MATEPDVAIRRNLMSEEPAAVKARQDYVDGVLALKEEPWTQGLSTWEFFVYWHHQAMMTFTPPTQRRRNAAHDGPVFLPWHRYFLLILEFQLQRVLDDPDVGIPYWDWAADAALPNPGQAPIWGANAMGGDGVPPDGAVGSGPFAGNPGDPGAFRVRLVTTATNQLTLVDRPLQRALAGDAALPELGDVDDVLAVTPYDRSPWSSDAFPSFRNSLEVGLHNGVHRWVGRDMVRSTSPNDPVFFLHHCNVDRIWRAWQRDNPTFPYVPGAGADDSLRSHRLNDVMFSPLDDEVTPAQVLDVDALYQYDVLP